MQMPIASPSSLKPQNGLAGVKYWREDMLAGLMVSLVSLPFSLAIAVASGAPPVAGLISAMYVGDTFEAMRSLAEDLRLSDLVEFTGRIPDEDVVRYLSTADETDMLRRRVDRATEYIALTPVTDARGLLAMRESLERIVAVPGLSKDVFEQASKSLEG